MLLTVDIYDLSMVEKPSSYVSSHGLRIVLVDVNEHDLKLAHEEIADIAGAPNVLAVKTDVSQIDEVVKRE